MNSSQKGFTLIELLIVIAIIAILAVAVILTLNPAELLRQSRDSTRVSDMATLKSAISLYLADVSTPNLASTSVATIGGYNACYLSTVQGDTNGTTTTRCFVFATLSGQNASSANSAYRRVDATGWLPINFNAISSGAPFGNLPIDPVNTQILYYAYAATGTSLTYELDSRMESTKYNPTPTGGLNDIGANASDGGDQDDWYETGTLLTL